MLRLRPAVRQALTSRQGQSRGWRVGSKKREVDSKEEDGRVGSSKMWGRWLHLRWERIKHKEW